MTRTTRRLRALLVAAAFLTLLALPAAARAAAQTSPFRVTTTDDHIDGAGCTDDDCSLREAIVAANASPGADTVDVPAGVYNLTISGPNEDSSKTGDLDITGPTTITGAGARSTIIDGQHADRDIEILHTDPPIQAPAQRAPAIIVGNTDVTISGVTIRNGTAPADQFGNGGKGGGIHVATSSASLTLSDSAVVDNAAQDSEGLGAGGGIEADQGSVTVSRSLIARNDASQGAGVYLFFAPATFTNVTITQNGHGAQVVPGAGVYVLGDGATRFLNVTLANNGGSGTPSFSALGGPSGGGIFARGSKSGTDVRATNTIVAGNLPANCEGTIASGGHNIDSGTTCAFAGAGDQNSTNPTLGSLADNGGPTDTLALLPGSPAINRADNAPCPPTDQRGVTRPQPAGGVCDIGAYEVLAKTDLAIKESDSPDPVRLGGIITYTVTGSNHGAFTDSNVKIGDKLPAGVQFVSAQPSQGTCSHAGQTVTCQVGTLPGSAPAAGKPGRTAQASTAVTVKIRVRAKRLGIVVNPVTISGSAPETTYTNNRATVNTRVIERNRPHISFSPPRGCVTGSFSFTVHIRDQSSLRGVRVALDGRTVATTRSKTFRVRVHAAGLSSKTHTLTVSAVDHYGNRAQRSAKFRRCRRAVLPDFTG